ncbi:uncharacterized protein LOC110094180 [Dendrobium catenatum]|uniref:uncharacterized protein LOC110094180 n=1 Tax=Dendrobium catenatum TaxID=906689 RepID=UPI0009F71D9D|nr:uncharacterized protein LOC110094180 [Dendrobium catenatum]
MDYFSKWAEAALFREVTFEHVINFFTHNVVYIFGESTKIYKFIDRNKIDWRYSSIYNPRANGLAEAFNTMLVKLLKKILTKNKREWLTKMAEALWAYCTTYKTPIKATPYSLVFGVEAVIFQKLETSPSPMNKDSKVKKETFVTAHSYKIEPKKLEVFRQHEA